MNEPYPSLWPEPSQCDCTGSVSSVLSVTDFGRVTGNTDSTVPACHHLHSVRKLFHRGAPLVFIKKPHLKLKFSGRKYIQNGAHPFLSSRESDVVVCWWPAPAQSHTTLIQRNLTDCSAGEISICCTPTIH